MQYIYTSLFILKAVLLSVLLYLGSERSTCLPLTISDSFQDKMYSTFSRLPLEILLDILQNVPDLPSLYRLICSSARVNAAFEFDPAPILDDVIDRSIPHFKHLARMIAIMGSHNIRIGPEIRLLSQLNFNSLLGEFSPLTKHVLFTAQPSYAFVANTPGPRYLLLTAYRIEHLFHICFVTLLQNIHELIFLESEPSPHYKSSRPGVFFNPAAWWSQSWVERFRIERALWKLFIYWTTRAIRNELTEDPTFRQYSNLMGRISPGIGPKLADYFNSYEVEEMNCISAALHEFLGWSPFAFFMMLSTQARKVYIKKVSSRFSFVLKETLHWKFEEPKPLKGPVAEARGQAVDSVFRMNHRYRRWYWSRWELTAREPGVGDFFDEGGFRFPDYLGLCLWDSQRLFYLGLQSGCESLPTTTKYFKQNELPLRWRDVFLEELVRSPGGQLRYIKYDRIISWCNKLDFLGPGFHSGPNSEKLDINSQYEKNLTRLLAAYDDALRI